MQLFTFVSCLCFALIKAQPVELQSPSPPLGQLVPTIDQEHFMLTPEGNQYKLSIVVPYGNYRDETVTLLNSKELSVNGLMGIVFDGNKYIYRAVYVADGEGYRVQYTYGPYTFSASANLLKSSAG